MPLILKAPARINILGNPSDANEGDFATISAAIDIYAHARVRKTANILIEQLGKKQDGSIASHQEAYSANEMPLPLTGRHDLVKAGINQLYNYSLEFKEKISKHGFSISTWSDVPRQSGLGGSSLFIILTLGGLRHLYELDQPEHNNYVLAELTQRAEAKDLGITAGYADRYVPFFGGIAYMDYRGKVFQKAIHDEPYVTYERLDTWVSEIPLVAISSGVARDSGDVHGKMRPKYLREYQSWISDGGDPPPMVCFMKKAWETAWRGKIALLKKDWETIGHLMNQNHKAVNEMMTYCGFEDGAGWANNMLINTALDHGAYGAKLTGAGSGGSVFAITEFKNIISLKTIWQETALKAGLNHAVVYSPKVTTTGLMIEESD